jgi:hypothetical protein
VLLLVPAAVPRAQLVSVATPLPSVLITAGEAGLMVPPPAVTVKVTATPALGLPKASVTTADGAAPTAAPAVALCDTALFAAMVLAAPALAEAVNVTGLPFGTAPVAVTVLLLVPALLPRVQLVSAATPFASVFTTAGLAGLIVPAPPVTVKVTATPCFGLPKASVTRTDGGAATGIPTVPAWLVALPAAIVFAAAAVPVAVNVTGLPVETEAEAVIVFVPALVPSVQLVNVATPAASVLTAAGLAGDDEPPPPVITNATATPATPFPLMSVTFTEGGAATAVPTVALCVVTELAAMA